ncbi:hypothetical protein P4123_15050 [Pseudomonas aeruginosa]|nr:hypothetical protein [Pseudomonas aeruginosa]
MSTASLSQFLQSALTGSHVSFFREDNELIEILLRGTEQERRDLSLLPSLAVPTENRPERGAVADRHARIRFRRGDHLAPQPPADGHRARRYLRRFAAGDPGRADRPDPGTDPRRAAGRLPAGGGRNGGGRGEGPGVR